MRVRNAFLGVIILLVLGFIVLKLIHKNDKQTISATLTFGKGRVGVIEIKGIIYESDEIIRDIRQFKEDESISAVVLRIDSPGGAVAPSQEIYREIQKLSEKKNVVASLGAVGASGGYYIACGAGTIFANPGTITGSIGVIMEFVNMKELFKWAKVEPFVLKSGEFKDAGAPYRDMTEVERKYLQGLIDNVHSQFVKAVAESRKLDIEKVKEISDGRIFTGEIAKEIGLVDELGDFEDAVDFAAKLAKISGKPELVYPVRKKFKFFDKILDNFTNLVLNRMYSGSWVNLSYIMFF